MEKWALKTENGEMGRGICVLRHRHNTAHVISAREDVLLRKKFREDGSRRDKMLRELA